MLTLASIHHLVWSADRLCFDMKGGARALGTLHQCAVPIHLSYDVQLRLVMAEIGRRVVQNFGLQVLQYCIALGIKRARHRGAGTVHTVPMAASECFKTIELCVKGAGPACNGDVS
jgi:hypothetical protein